jgi:hypothetical protein
VTRPDAPQVDVVQPERYAPGAELGVPPHVRRTIAYILGAFALAVIGASLWRSRWAWGAVVLLAFVSIACLAAWHARQPTSVASSSDERSGIWLDRWTRYTAFADGEFRHPLAKSDAAVWPIFFSRRHAQDIDLRLECAADGTPQTFTGRLKRGQALVFLTRSLEPDMPTPTPLPSTTAPTH